MTLYSHPTPAASQPSADALLRKRDSLRLQYRPHVPLPYQDALDEAIATVRQLEAQLAARDEQVGRMRENLRDIEWTDYGNTDDMASCPACGGYEKHGHEDDCWLKAAIARAGALP